MTAERRSRLDDGQEGVALVLALLFVLAMSAVGASMVALSQSEAVSSQNYRLMSQARYGAESGVHRAINYFLNSYTLPGSGADPLANYDMTVSPVTYQNQPVVLSTMATVASNYPAAATRNAFIAAVQGALPAGSSSVQYTASAVLVSMRQIQSYGAGASTVVQTWRITGSGSIAGVRNAAVEVVSTLEREIVPTHTYSAFATNPGCGALNFSGGVTTDSYDSASMTLVAGKPATQSHTGDVGTNGNLTEGGGSVINGTLSTPRSGVGNCKAGAVDALTQNGGAVLTGGLVQLPQAVAYPMPAAPSPVPPETNNQIAANATCATAGMATNCAGTGGVLTLTPTAGTPLVLGNVKLTGGSTLHLRAGTYNLNSITLAGGSSVILDSGPVIMNIEGDDVVTALDFTGGSLSNSTFVPSNFQVQYRGTGNIKLNGGTQSSGMIYAPQSAITLTGGADFFGSVLGATVTVNGGTRIHYDRQLSQTFFSVGNSMLSTFTWKKY